MKSTIILLLLCISIEKLFKEPVYHFSAEQGASTCLFPKTADLFYRARTEVFSTEGDVDYGLIRCLHLSSDFPFLYSKGNFFDFDEPIRIGNGLQLKNIPQELVTKYNLPFYEDSPDFKDKMFSKASPLVRKDEIDQLMIDFYSFYLQKNQAGLQRMSRTLRTAKLFLIGENPSTTAKIMKTNSILAIRHLFPSLHNDTLSLISNYSKPIKSYTTQPHISVIYIDADVMNEPGFFSFLFKLYNDLINRRESEVAIYMLYENQMSYIVNFTTFKEKEDLRRLFESIKPPKKANETLKLDIMKEQIDKIVEHAVRAFSNQLLVISTIDQFKSIKDELIPGLSAVFFSLNKKEVGEGSPNHFEFSSFKKIEQLLVRGEMLPDFYCPQFWPDKSYLVESTKNELFFNFKVQFDFSANLVLYVSPFESKELQPLIEVCISYDSPFLKHTSIRLKGAQKLVFAETLFRAGDGLPSKGDGKTYLRIKSPSSKLIVSFSNCLNTHECSPGVYDTAVDIEVDDNEWEILLILVLTIIIILLISCIVFVVYLKSQKKKQYKLQEFSSLLNQFE